MLLAVLPAAFPVFVAVAFQVGAALKSAEFQPATVTSPADSQRVVRDARSAQANFERTRRANLPVENGGSSGRCDVRVGRFCYWWDDGEFQPPPEPAKTKAARASLLERLAQGAHRIPGDGWIAGQRVRYLVEDNRGADAVNAAHECRADASWCAALAGFAFHGAGDFVHADSAFDAALAAMSESERCHWTDISLLLEGDARKRYERLPCAQRGEFEARFWALSRPLYVVPANDFRTEHFARLTMVRLIRMSGYTHDMAFGEDSEELLMRYGWETGWTRSPPGMANPFDVHVIGHEPTPAFDFVPDAGVLSVPDSASLSDWELHDRLAQSRYAPRYARSVGELDTQVAFFRRGDSAIVVAAFDATAQTGFTHDTIDAALAVAPAASPDSAIVTTDSAAHRRGVLVATAEWRPAIISVETRDSAERRVARARAVFRPPSSSGRVTISDLLLFDDPSTLPTSLDEATPRARGSLKVDRTKPVGVYWEMYGLSPEGETLAYRLTVTRERTPWYRRAAEKLGVVERRAPVRMQWDEPSARPGAAHTRALAVDFSTLPEGRYRIELTLETGSLTIATATRTVEVTR
jgi:hypothetical protein